MMDGTISFTPAELWGGVLAVAGGLTVLSKAADILGNIISKFKKPNAKQDARLDDHENRIETLEKNDAEAQKHIASLDQGTRVSQRAMLALLGHAIDGNNDKQMRDSREEIQNFLINR